VDGHSGCGDGDHVDVEADVVDEDVRACEVDMQKEVDL